MLSLGVSPDAGRTALALSLALPLIQSHELVRRIRFVRHDERGAFFLDLLVYGMRLPGLWVAYDHGWISGAPDALVLIGLSSIPGLLAAARLFRPGGCSRAIIRDAVIRHWKISRWLSLSILLPWVTYYATSAGVAAFLGTAALGLIAATLNLVGSINVFYLAIGNVLPVRAAHQFAKSGPAAMLRYLGHVAGWGGVLVACCLGVLAMFPDFWFYIFFARTDARAALLIRLWSLDYFFAFFIIPLQIGLTTLENTRPVFLAKLAAVALRAAAAGPLIWLTGVYGFVLAQSAGTATEAGILSIRLRRGVANQPLFDTENSIREQFPGESRIV
jgi:O-antigen/teichoic acid export membrane protein